jgi:hypothetical protein
MAKPIVKIKKGNNKPLDYQFNLGIQLGLTAGELGVNLTDKAFYIGDNFGKAITFGAEISTDITLGGATPSDNKIPTEKAIRTFIGASPPTTSSTAIISRYSSGPITINALATAPIAFSSFEFADVGTTNLDVTSNNLFTYNGSNTGYYLITYQICWALFPSTQVYNTREIIRSSWIQKNPSDTQNLGINVYGFSTLLCPPLGSSNIGAINGVNCGSAVISLTNGQSFSILCRNHASANYNAGLVNCQINLGGSPPLQTNFSRASRLQIIKL